MAGYTPNSGYSDLLGQLIGSSTPGPQSNQINLDTMLQRPSLAAPVDPTLGGEVQRPFSHQDIAQHHGLGNILSILGDAALVRLGLPAQYLPHVQAAKEADALQNYNTDPNSAIQALTLVNPDRAESMRNEMFLNAVRQSQAQTAALTGQKTLAELPGVEADSREKVLTPISGLVGKATADTYPGIRAYADKTLRANGLGPVADLLPQKFDPDSITNWSQSALTPDKQAQIAYRNRRGDQFDEQLGLNRENVDSEVGYRGEMAGVAHQNADTHANDVNDEISYRAWQKVHGDKTAKTAADDQAGRAEYRKWLMAHPSKQRAGVSLPPPRKVGDTVHGSDGSNFTSKDGKTWSPL